MSFGAEAWKRKLYEAVELIQRRVMTRIQVQKESISAEFLRCVQEKNILGQYLQADDFFWLRFFITGKKVTNYVLEKPWIKRSNLLEYLLEENFDKTKVFV